MITKAFDACLGVLLFVVVILAALKLGVWLGILP